MYTDPQSPSLLPFGVEYDWDDKTENQKQWLIRRDTGERIEEGDKSSWYYRRAADMNFGWLEDIYHDAEYRPFRTQASMNGMSTYATYHSVHGYVVPGTDTYSLDDLHRHLIRLNRST